MLQTCDLLSHTHFMFSGVTNTIGSISQGKQKLNTSNKSINLHKITKNTKYLLPTQSKNQKWLILLAQKAMFQLICSTCHHYRTQGDSLQCRARSPTIFSYQMEKAHNSVRSSIPGRLTD